MSPMFPATCCILLKRSFSVSATFSTKLGETPWNREKYYFLSFWICNNKTRSMAVLKLNWKKNFWTLTVNFYTIKVWKSFQRRNCCEVWKMRRSCIVISALVQIVTHRHALVGGNDSQWSLALLTSWKFENLATSCNNIVNMITFINY